MSNAATLFASAFSFLFGGDAVEPPAPPAPVVAAAPAVTEAASVAVDAAPVAFEVAPPPVPLVEAMSDDEALTLAQAPAIDPTLKAIVDKLQKRYEGTTDFSATFTQRFTYTVMKRTQVSKGTVLFRRPGLMRWDYATPSPKTFAVAEGKLTLWQKDDNSVLVDHCFKEDSLTASVSFLWGAGNILEQFDVQPFPAGFGKPTDHHLLLLPKDKNNIFLKLILVVDPKSYDVKQSVLVDAQGNVNQFIFDDLKLNRGVKKNAFEVNLPKGLKAQRLPGSCDPGRKAP
jgi:outer membrane lipoprotein carrier protein